MDRDFEYQELSGIVERLERYEKGQGVFSSLLRSCYFQLGWTEETGAKALDISQPNFRRWFSGEVVPPADKLVVKFLRQEIQTRLDALWSTR